MEIIKNINLLLAFLLELGMLFGFGYWGFKTGATTLIRIGLGIGVPLLIVVVWGIFLAPNAAMRLQNPWLRIAEIAIFGTAVWALYRAGQPTLAGIFGVIYLINTILIILWKQ